MLSDIIFYQDSFDAPAWLIYYISRPLVGIFEPVPIVPAIVPKDRLAATNGDANPSSSGSPSKTAANGTTTVLKKKDIRNFKELLDNFPMISRQMQPGLERLFREFAKELENRVSLAPRENRPPLPPRRRSSLTSLESLPVSMHSSLSNRSTLSNGFGPVPKSLELGEEEDTMRRSLETAVTAAIDLFQMVDKAQLSLLGATTELTGPIVERMIERYITEQMHDNVLFPRICSIRKLEDHELDVNIRQMGDIDVSQVGISVGDSVHERQELSVRLKKGVDAFKSMGVASSPHEMLDVLLATQKIVTTSESVLNIPGRESRSSRPDGSMSEKQDMTVNADMLVSLLLIVVIRSGVKHLQARLSYMRHFIYIDDVESGEMGYALSTFEAVVSYLIQDSGGLRRASKHNRKLWNAAKTGNIADLKSVLEPTAEFEDDELLLLSHRRNSLTENSLRALDRRGSFSASENHRNIDPDPLAHVFPFLRAPTPPIDQNHLKAKKRVSMDTRSLSSSSGYSFRSRSNTITSYTSNGNEDLSLERISHTHGPGGESVLMMATEAGQPWSLKYLLSRTQIYSSDLVFRDCNNEGTTLLSAAVQLGHKETISALLDYIYANVASEAELAAYISRQDTKGRCVAHYIFHQPHLIALIGKLLPWRLRDNNGQTPLFALCRSYDHEDYKWMVEEGLSTATVYQNDGEPLHLNDHVDNKGNTLLHIVNDPRIASRILQYCDSDVNAPNDKHFTPLMMASKYGRIDLVRALFADARVDLWARDVRGLTAVELAKDDEVRNRFDDLVLLSNEPLFDGRITTVVRSFFVEDGTIRLILKSGAPNHDNAATITVTTCRRSLADFESLARWLSLELPASWLPNISSFQSPFLIPSRPSRSLLRDTQFRLDSWLKILLTHPTFSTHEMVWEFFLVPDIDPAMLEERSRRKAETRAERVREEYEPISDVRDVELFVQHARESVRGMHHSTKSVLRRVNRIRVVLNDLAEAGALFAPALSTLTFLPDHYKTAVVQFVKCLAQSESSPHSGFYYNMLAISSTITAILAALQRPTALIGSISATHKAIDRHSLSIRRSDRWPLGLLDDTRNRIQRDAVEKMDKSVGELESLGKELRYTQQTVAGELASWQESRVRMGRDACKQLAKRMIIVEKARLESMRRALKTITKEIEKEAN